MVKQKTIFYLFLGSIILIIGVSCAAVIGITSISKTLTETTQIIQYENNYWDFYTPFSDIYIVDMSQYDGGTIVNLYPEGNITFSFDNDGTIRKWVGDHFIECKRSGKYVIITDTDIPFMPEIKPSTWGAPIGYTDDLTAMREILKTPRDGDCSKQVDTVVKLASERGIIVRRINLWNPSPNGMLTAEGHTTMEVYDRETKQWVWMDPLYNIVEGKMRNRVLTIYDLYISVNRGDDVTLTTVMGEEIQFSNWKYNKTWSNYLNPSQTISYVPQSAYNFKR